MPDITMCNNDKCPSSNICNRQAVKPDSLYQSVSTYAFDIDTGSCEDFMPIESKENEKRNKKSKR